MGPPTHTGSGLPQCCRMHGVVGNAPSTQVPEHVPLTKQKPPQLLLALVQVGLVVVVAELVVVVVAGIVVVVAEVVVVVVAPATVVAVVLGTH